MNPSESTYAMICSIQDAVGSIRGMLRHQVHLEKDPAMQEQLRRLSGALLALETAHLQPAFELADDNLFTKSELRTQLQ